MSVISVASTMVWPTATLSVRPLCVRITQMYNVQPGGGGSGRRINPSCYFRGSIEVGSFSATHSVNACIFECGLGRQTAQVLIQVLHFSPL